MDEDKQKQPEDLEETEATVLSAREAMSIIAPDAASPDSGQESASSDDQSPTG